jgi:K+-transporting ATPase ATPase C chain
MTYLLPSLRLWIVTLLVCVAGYGALVLGFAQALAPFQAEGSILMRDGKPVGSALIAQNFTQDRYFWPRPSAADYNGMGAAGSNLSPTSDKLKQRAEETVSRYAASPDAPLPADLVAASGGGLDPHISLAGARYQASRIAAARNIPVAQVQALIDRLAFAPGGPAAPDRIINVLELNLALDRLGR